MSFTSYQYYIFLFVTAVLYFNIQIRFRTTLLLIASYIFYLSFEPRALFFILATTVVSYTAAFIMQRSGEKRLRTFALLVSLSVELILLSLTKYWNLLAQSAELFQPIQILVPLGISFYTFQTIGYLFDVYRKRLPAETNFLRYALFLSFFPHLLSGPIEPAQHFLPQLQKFAKFNARALAIGCFLIVLGLFKKFVIADHLAPLVNLIFDEPTAHQGLAVGVGLFLTRYQIYCDFSGYTDIALGSAQILGLHLSANFNRPFFSSSITEYWRRWHMSLGHWIRQYIFYPLVSTPFARLGFHGLILLTFLILGLWHGGTLNFLIYGLWHGLFVILDGQTRAYRFRFYQFIKISNYPKILEALNTVFTFFLIVIPPTLFFRATSFQNSIILLQNLNTNWKFTDLFFISESLQLSWHLRTALIAIVILELCNWWQSRNQQQIQNWNLRRFWACTSLIAITIILFGYFAQNSKFIYNQF